MYNLYLIYIYALYIIQYITFHYYITILLYNMYIIITLSLHYHYGRVYWRGGTSRQVLGEIFRWCLADCSNFKRRPNSSSCVQLSFSFLFFVGFVFNFIDMFHIVQKIIKFSAHNSFSGSKVFCTFEKHMSAE